MYVFGGRPALCAYPSCSLVSSFPLVAHTCFHSGCSGPHDFTVVSHLSSTLVCAPYASGCKFQWLQVSRVTLDEKMLLLDLCQLPCLAAAQDSFTSVWVKAGIILSQETGNQWIFNCAWTSWKHGFLLFGAYVGAIFWCFCVVNPPKQHHQNNTEENRQPSAKSLSSTWRLYMPHFVSLLKLKWSETYKKALSAKRRDRRCSRCDGRE